MDVYLIKKRQYPAPSHLKRESANFLDDAVKFGDIGVKDVENLSPLVFYQFHFEIRRGTTKSTTKIYGIPNYFTIKF